MLTSDDVPSVYLIRNKTTGKVYVGSSVRGLRRLRQHKRDLKVKRHVNSYLQFAYNKHGLADFEFSVLEVCTEENRFEREQWWIDHLSASDPKIGYNISHSVVSPAPAPLRSKISKEYWDSLTDEEREEQSRLRKALWDDPAWRDEREKELAVKGAKQRAKRVADPDFNSQCLAGLARQRADPEAQARRAAKIREAWNRPEVRAAQSARKKALAQDPEYMAAHNARAASEASKAKLREHNKKQFENLEMRAKRLEGLQKARKSFWDDPIKRAERLELLHRKRDEAAAARRLWCKSQQ